MTDTKTAQEKALEAFEEILDGNFRYQRHYESAVAKVKAALQAPAVPREAIDRKMKLDIVRSFDGRTCVYLDDTRIAGGKPALGKNLIDSWTVKSSDISALLGGKENE